MVLTFCTTMPYEPAADPLHPGGGGAEGAIDWVTACLASKLATGLAVAAAARVRSRSAFCISLTLLGSGINYKI